PGVPHGPGRAGHAHRPARPRQRRAPQAGSAALRHLLLTVPRLRRARHRRGRDARLPPAGLVRRRAAAPRRPGGLLLQRHHERLRPHAPLRLAGRGGGPLGDLRLRQGAAALAERRPRRHPRGRRGHPADRGGSQMSLSAHDGHVRPTLHLAPPATDRFQATALGVGVIAVVGAAVLAFFGDANFFQSYLMAYLFWLGLSLGALVLSFAQHLAGGPWGSLVARPLESAMTLIPLMALLFVPVLLGMNQLYPWTDAAYVAEHPTVAAKTEYLNVPWFVIRAVVYFAVWTGAALLYRRTSLRQDEDASNAGTIGYRLRSASGLWFVFYVLTMTFAGIDWAMSLTPVWFSGIYPVILMASQAITGIAFVILAVSWLAERNPTVDALLTPRRLQDLGNFLLAFTMFWAYTQVSQLI